MLIIVNNTCAMLLAADESLKLVSERLSRSSTVLTLDIYWHVLPSMRRAPDGLLAMRPLSLTQTRADSPCPRASALLATYLNLLNNR